MKPTYKKIVVKVGTNVITKDDGFLDKKIMARIVGQVALLKKRGVAVAMVSSGAMGAGRSLIQLKNTKSEVTRRQALASVGQVSLMSTYGELFQAHGLCVAQVLATKEDFRDREHYMNMKQCVDGLLVEGIIPILNENDVVAVTEIMFTDNDELAGLVSAMLDADALIILSSIDGVFDKDPREKDARVIPVLDPTTMDITQFATAKTSSLGRGGMGTKLGVAKKCASVGIATHIINGMKDGALVQVFEGGNVGTTIPASAKKVSAVKKWVAHSSGHEKGVVYLNECAEPVLRAEGRAVSLLPVGITKVEGDFEKGDIIKIKNEKGKDIGFGKAEYGSEMAKKYIGQKGKKALVHYDYLYLL